MTSVLRHVDGAWDHRWESVLSALDGVDDELATWTHPAYAAVEREEGWPAPGTIHWHVAHLAHCKRHYAELLRRRGADGGAEGMPPPPERVPDVPFAASRAELDAAHAALRAEVATLDDDDLEQRTGNGMTVDELVAMATRHDVWHAAQIVVVKRLARTPR